MSIRFGPFNHGLLDGALPNFHEAFITTTLQPYAEYQLKLGSSLSITPGIKLAYYQQDFTQYADNGKTVGSLNGAPSVMHTAQYDSWLPSIDAHYRLQSNWSAYAQYGKGQNIPPTSIYDVKGALVAIVPQPLLTDTAQFGTVWKSHRATLDVDYYHIHFQNTYSSTFDPVSGDTNYYQTAPSITKGMEAESTILIGGGLALYVNGTVGSARYTDTNQWVQNTPSDTETIGLTFNQRSWNLGFFSKRVGQMYNDNGATHQAVAIDAFNITNLFANYTIGGSSWLSRSRLRFAVNNLLDSHAITAVTPASTTTSVPSPNDILTLMSGRSVSASITIGVSGR